MYYSIYYFFHESAVHGARRLRELSAGRSAFWTLRALTAAAWYPAAFSYHFRGSTVSV